MDVRDSLHLGICRKEQCDLCNACDLQSLRLVGHCLQSACSQSMSVIEVRIETHLVYRVE